MLLSFTNRVRSSLLILGSIFDFLARWPLTLINVHFGKSLLNYSVKVPTFLLDFIWIYFSLFSLLFSICLSAVCNSQSNYSKMSVRYAFAYLHFLRQQFRSSHLRYLIFFQSYQFFLVRQASKISPKVISRRLQTLKLLVLRYFYFPTVSGAHDFCSNNSDVFHTI